MQSYLVNQRTLTSAVDNTSTNEKCLRHAMIYNLLCFHGIRWVLLSCIHSKNVRVKNSGSFRNDPIWVKNASFNAVMGHIWINFRTKCLTRNSASREKARWRCMERAGS